MDQARLAITKGAPGIVWSTAQVAWKMASDSQSQTLAASSVRETIKKLQSEGMYVLGMASKELLSAEISEQVEQDMTFMGLLVLMDPPRPQAAEAIATTRAAGIRVVMITGDNGLTAQAVAAELGIGQNVVDARDMAGLNNSRAF